MHPAVSSAGVSRRSSKQPRLQAPTGITEPSDTPLHANHLARLPLEMLTEVLSYTIPPDILALSRTSRYFCATLINNPKIWRDARKRFHPKAIPDPTPNWTESAYIAFLFDGHPCEVCKKMTYRTPHSYALRAYVCHDDATKWTKSLKHISSTLGAAMDLAHIAAVQSWLPYNEESYNTNSDSKAYRPLEWEAHLRRHKRSIQSPRHYAVIQQEFAKKSTYLPLIMKHSSKLRTWGVAFECWRKDLNAKNIKFLKDKATEEEWNIHDFMNTPSYQSLRKHSNKTFELITETDFGAVKDQFRHEVVKCGQDRVRRIIDNNARINREELRSYYNMLKTVATSPMPPYTEFRRLNMVRTLETKNTNAAIALDESETIQTVSAELKANEATRNHIRQEMENWLDDTRKKLAIKLGDPYPFLATVTERIHTVDRTTAWFRCTRCDRVGRDLQEDQALTFANVCKHQCEGITKKQRLDCQWDVKFFEPDFKAIAAAKEMLRVCNLDEQSATEEELKSFGRRFHCNTCTCSIVFDASSVVGHSKRHETITLELLSQDQADAMLAAPLERGLVSKVMSRSKSGKEMRHQKVFVCRHCNNPKSLTFDGLRSHLKSKHQIAHVRDEDIFQLKQTSLKKVDGI